MHVDDDMDVEPVEENNEDWNEGKNEENGSRPPTVTSVYSGKQKEERDTAAEIMAEKVQLLRPLTKMRFTRKFKHFGREIQNIEEDTNDSYRFFPPVKDPRYQPADQRLERDYGVQCGESLVESTAQTEWFRKVNHFSQVNISESVSQTDIQESMDSPAVEEFLKNVSELLFEALDQNTTIDIFKDDFVDLVIDDSFIGTKSESQFIEIQSFPHAMSKYRKIASLDWQPNNRAVIALSTIDIRDFSSRVLDLGKPTSSQVYIWSFQDPTYPSYILNAPNDVSAIQFNPAMPYILAGGMINGQILIWNIEKEEKEFEKIIIDMKGDEIEKPQIPTLEYSQISLTEMSHKSAVTGIQWITKGKEVRNNGTMAAINEEECYQFLTLGMDSQIILWDIRKEKKRLSVKKSERMKDAWIPFAVMPILQLDLTSELPTFALSVSMKNPYQLCCTTTEGEFITADWSPVEGEGANAETTFNSVNIANGIYGRSNGHLGLTHSISRSPFFDDILLTIGKATCKIWKVGCPDPIWTSCFKFNVSYSCGSWSPTRPGVLLLGRSDGFIEVWDFLDKSHDCSMVSHFSISQQNVPLTELKFRSGTGVGKLSFQFIAVGTQNGSLSVVEVPKNLIRPLPDEEKLVRNLFNREHEKVLYFKERWKIREKEGEEKKIQQLSEKSSDTASEIGTTTGSQHTQQNTNQESVQSEKKPMIDKVELKKKFLRLIQE
ncbi:hypothetical protein NAEGRDRAFT_57343 [Naegleria gruberi]|uniref:Uncharacterized protein n=1 Tax=Naegleria gruberi TaxID=5762 RepID=D2V732_NAEGR|nr:uncharacterized protein NAEGRDRAFT_57343 [Naegleria gruberi]EFC47301.1 hypothetical protein NAEGRDRAFT_57343 [Naegleria gruberi]|eukprot:XP_002680045.1 hypothetical protein NAEGRDRAFT_57343 [Naegleria gruberi strain NEG-M]